MPCTAFAGCCCWPVAPFWPAGAPEIAPNRLAAPPDFSVNLGFWNVPARLKGKVILPLAKVAPEMPPKFGEGVLAGGDFRHALVIEAASPAKPRLPVPSTSTPLPTMVALVVLIRLFAMVKTNGDGGEGTRIAGRRTHLRKLGQFQQILVQLQTGQLPVADGHLPGAANSRQGVG